jgi:hypothetical protein
VLAGLAERGHSIVLAAERQRNRPLALPKNLTLANPRLIARGAPGRIEITACPVRRADAWKDIAPVVRRSRDFLRFLDPRYAHAAKLEARAFSIAEDAIPSDRFFELFITHERADLVLVWNDIQRREAIDLHGVPAARVIVVGAPRFDDFYAMAPSTSREDFCRQNGLDASRPFLLYVFSSEFVAPHEVDFVRRWIRALRNGPYAALRDCGMLVRSHPAHQKLWAKADLAEANVAVWAAKETMNADQGLYDSLSHCAAVVGLNTSAMLEAGILGKPVFTVIADEFAGGQSQTLHCNYLRASNGGLLHEAPTLDEHLEQLSCALAGAAASEQAARFVERFVRPRGRTMPVAPSWLKKSSVWLRWSSGRAA